MANELTMQELNTAMNHTRDALKWAEILKEHIGGAVPCSDQDKIEIRKHIMNELDEAHKGIFTNGQTT